MDVRLTGLMEFFVSDTSFPLAGHIIRGGLRDLLDGRAFQAVYQHIERQFQGSTARGRFPLYAGGDFGRDDAYPEIALIGKQGQGLDMADNDPSGGSNAALRQGLQILGQNGVPVAVRARQLPLLHDSVGFQGQFSHRVIPFNKRSRGARPQSRW